MADDVTLLPCPWCAGTDLLRPMQDAWEKWLIGCRSCGAEGPQADDPAMTITAWNTRATPRTPEPAHTSGAGLKPVEEPVASDDALRAESVADQVIADVEKFLARQGGFDAYAEHVRNGTTTGWSQLRSRIWLAVRAALTTGRDAS